jgi:flagellin
MAFKIATNVASLNTQRWLGISTAAENKSLERLSSGYKINRAADDAAGSSLALKLNVKGMAINKGIDNGNQAVAMLQTAEGGVDQIANILTRLKELATQSASDNTTDRASLEAERANLVGEINNIAAGTKYESTGLLQGASTAAGFGVSLTVGQGFSSFDVSGAKAGTFTLTVATAGATTIALYDGTTTQTVTIVKPTGFNTAVANFNQLGVKVTINASVGVTTATNGFTVTAGTSSFAFQLGSDNASQDQISIAIGNFNANVAGGGVFGTTLTTGDINTKATAQTYMDTVDQAVTNLNTQRGAIGAAQNQLGYHVANLQTMYENTQSAQSTIKDADFAKEMADFTKHQIMTQSGIAMLAQSNQLPQLVLSLLK